MAFLRLRKADLQIYGLFALFLMCIHQLHIGTKNDNTVIALQERVVSEDLKPLKGILGTEHKKVSKKENDKNIGRRVSQKKDSKDTESLADVERLDYEEFKNDKESSQTEKGKQQMPEKTKNVKMGILQKKAKDKPGLLDDGIHNITVINKTLNMTDRDINVEVKTLGTTVKIDLPKPHNIDRDIDSMSLVSI